MALPDEPSWKETDEVKMKALQVKCSARLGLYCNITKDKCNPPNDCFKIECITLIKQGY